MSLERLQDESDLEYRYRICKSRIENDLTWPQLGELLGANHDTLRKWFVDFHNGYDYAIKSNATTTSEIEHLERKQLDLELERKKKATVAVGYNKILREESRRELLFEKFRESLVQFQLTPPSFNELRISNGERGGVLGFADIHYGKEFKSINNVYNEKILLERMERLLAETVAIVRKENLSHLDIVNAGDSVEGISLRISQLQALQYGMVDSTVKFQRMIVEWLNKLSRDVALTYHHVNSANHTELRPLGTSRGEFPAEDMERIIQVYVHDMLEKNERIKVPNYFNEPLVRFDVCGNKIYAIHGHALRGNVDGAISKLSQIHREFIDILLLGHYHHGKETTVSEGANGNCEVLQLPSVMGSDEFSDSLFTGSKPGAKLYIFEKNKGKTIGYDIKL